MARQAFFFASQKYLNFLDYKNKTSKCFKCEHETSLYCLLASFFELAETGNSIITHYVVISQNKIAFFWHQNGYFGRRQSFGVLFGSLWIISYFLCRQCCWGEVRNIVRCIYREAGTSLAGKWLLYDSLCLITDLFIYLLITFCQSYMCAIYFSHYFDVLSCYLHVVCENHYFSIIPMKVSCHHFMKEIHCTHVQVTTFVYM